MVSELSISTNGSVPLGKKQKRFNSLVKSANQLRTALRSWRDADYDLHRGAAKIEKLLDDHRLLTRELVVLFDRHASNPAFSQADRKQLIATVIKFARDLLAKRPDPEIKAIYNRHTQSDFDIERAAEEAEQSSAMQQVLEEHGFEFDKDFERLEELEAAARAQQAERERSGDERKATRKKSSRQVAAEERKAAAEVQAGKVLQDVYRQLVRALHPDREQDPAERARKTALMQDVNVAYERGDLLELLELQLRFEQIDREHIGALAEERLDHFIKLLTQQVAQLRDELASVEHGYRVQLDVFPPRKLPVAYVLAAMRDDADQLIQDLARMRRDLAFFADAVSLRAWLRDQRDRQSRQARQFTEMMATMGTSQRRRR